MNVKRNEGFADYISLFLTEDCDDLQYALHNYLFGETSLIPLEEDALILSLDVDAFMVPLKKEALMIPLEEDASMMIPNKPFDLVIEKNGSNLPVAAVIDDVPACESNSDKMMSVSHFLASGYCNMKLIDSEITTEDPTSNQNISKHNIPKLPESMKRCDASYNYELLGPIRSALVKISASGKVAVDRLGVEFFKEYSESILPSHEQRTQVKRFDAEMPKECDKKNTFGSDHGEYSWRQEGSLFSACMTNPPFYDEDEEVQFERRANVVTYIHCLYSNID